MSQGRECSDPQMCRKTPETINLENNQITLEYNEYYSHYGMTDFVLLIFYTNSCTSSGSPVCRFVRIKELCSKSMIYFRS